MSSHCTRAAACDCQEHVKQEGEPGLVYLNAAQLHESVTGLRLGYTWWKYRWKVNEIKTLDSIWMLKFKCKNMVQRNRCHVSYFFRYGHKNILDEPETSGLCWRTVLSHSHILLLKKKKRATWESLTAAKWVPKPCKHFHFSQLTRLFWRERGLEMSLAATDASN